MKNSLVTYLVHAWASLLLTCENTDGARGTKCGLWSHQKMLKPQRSAAAAESALEAVSSRVVLRPTAWSLLWSSAQDPPYWSKKSWHTTVWRSKETCKLLATKGKATHFPHEPLENYSIHFRFRTLFSGLSFRGCEFVVTLGSSRFYFPDHSAILQIANRWRHGICDFPPSPPPPFLNQRACGP